MNTVIEFRNVSKSFKLGQNVDSLRDLIPHLMSKFLPGLNKQKKRETFWALKDVTFEIKRGETVGLIGHNGSGKTTTLKLLSGILRQTKGIISKKGRIGALIEVGAGFHGDLTGRENVYLNGSIMGMKKWEIEKKFDEIVAFAEVEDFIDTPVKRYSSGMYVRLGFSVAAHLEPEILLIDEVLAVGDLGFQNKCVQKIKELIKGGCTIVFVSHNVALVESICSRTILLNNGRLVHDGKTSEAISVFLRLLEDASIRHEKGAGTSGKYCELLGINILKTNGEKCQNERIMDKGVLEFEYILHENLQALVLRFRVTKGSMIAFRTNSKVDRFKLDTTKGIHKIKVELDVSQLRGRFELAASLTDFSGTVYHSVSGRSLLIESCGKHEGFIDLKPKWFRN